MTGIFAKASTVLTIVLAIGAAPTVNATPETDFIQTLTDGGLHVYDPQKTIAFGYTICAALTANTGDTVAQTIYDNANRTEVPTLDVANLWVLAAATSLCQTQFHPERIIPIQGGAA